MGTPDPPQRFPQNKNMGKNVIPKVNRKSKLKCVCIMYETSIPLCFRTPSPNGTTRRLYINIFLVRNVKKDFYYAMFRGVWGLFRLRLPLYFGPYSVFPAPVFQKNPYSVFHDPAELSFSIKASADIWTLPNDFLMTKIIAYTILYRYNVIIKGVVIIYWWGTGVLR